MRQNKHSANPIRDLAATTISSTDTRFPSALHGAPFGLEFLQVTGIGDFAVLDQPLLGFCCSSKCPGDVILQIYDLARALRDAMIPVIGGFHSPMEKECLDLLLRGRQPIVICPARNVERMRVSKELRASVAMGRVLVVSPFGRRHCRITVQLAECRNLFAAALATEIFVGHAETQSKTEQFALKLLRAGKTVLLLDASKNRTLEKHGAVPLSVESLVSRLGKWQPATLPDGPTTSK